MKEINFELTDDGQTTKYTIQRDEKDYLLVVQDGPDSCKMRISLECVKKLMEALAWMIK